MVGLMKPVLIKYAQISIFLTIATFKTTLKTLLQSCHYSVNRAFITVQLYLLFTVPITASV